MTTTTTKRKTTRKRKPTPTTTTHGPHGEPHYYEALSGEILEYHPRKSHEINMDARYLTLPSVAIISIVLAFMFGTYQVITERNRLDGRMDKIISSVERLAHSVERLAIQYATHTSDRFSRTDFDLFCFKAEAVNQNFKCPPLPRKAIIGGTAPSSAGYDSEKAFRDAILQGLKKGG